MDNLIFSNSTHIHFLVMPKQNNFSVIYILLEIKPYQIVIFLGHPVEKSVKCKTNEKMIDDSLCPEIAAPVDS